MGTTRDEAEAAAVVDTFPQYFTALWPQHRYVRVDGPLKVSIVHDDGRVEACGSLSLGLMRIGVRDGFRQRLTDADVRLIDGRTT